MSENRQRRKAAWSELTKKKNKREGDRRREVSRSKRIDQLKSDCELRFWYKSFDHRRAKVCSGSFHNQPSRDESSGEKEGDGSTKSP